MISTKRLNISSRGINSKKKNLTKYPLLISPWDRDVLRLFANLWKVRLRRKNNVGIACIAITETWLVTDTDQIVSYELTPDGYKVFHKPRRGRKGGGVAVIARLKLKLVEEMQSCKNVQFEHIGCAMYSQDHKFRMSVLYRPPLLSLSSSLRSLLNI